MYRRDLTVDPRRTLCLAVLLVTIAGFRPCDATSIVVLVSRHAIVVGCDGKLTGANSGITDKIASVNDRMVLAGYGVESIGRPNGTVYYSFRTFSDEVKSHLSPKASISALAQEVRKQLIAKFENFDAAIASGMVHQEQIPFSGPLITFYVAGYENGNPRAYSIELDIDWRNASHDVPEPNPLYPNDQNAKLFYGGEVLAIQELLTNRTGEIRKLMARSFPQEIDALDHSRDMPADKMKRAARGLIELEAECSADTVGFPVTVFTISQNGKKIDETRWLEPPVSDHFSKKCPSATQ